MAKWVTYEYIADEKVVRIFCACFIFRLLYSSPYMYVTEREKKQFSVRWKEPQV